MALTFKRRARTNPLRSFMEGSISAANNEFDLRDKERLKQADLQKALITAMLRHGLDMEKLDKGNEFKNRLQEDEQKFRSEENAKKLSADDKKMLKSDDIKNKLLNLKRAELAYKLRKQQENLFGRE